MGRGLLQALWHCLYRLSDPAPHHQRERLLVRRSAGGLSQATAISGFNQRDLSDQNEPTGKQRRYCFLVGSSCRRQYGQEMLRQLNRERRLAAYFSVERNRPRVPFGGDGDGARLEMVQARQAA